MKTESKVLPTVFSMLRAFQMVSWSFFGIRKRSEFHKDAAQVTPAQLVFVAIVSGLLFVIGLIAVVNLIV
jgi:Protein of unknown function (DUF2970)